MGPWAGELPYVLLHWVLKMSGGSLISESGHTAGNDNISGAHFLPLKLCIRIPILQILRTQLDYYINVIVEFQAKLKMSTEAKCI